MSRPVRLMAATLALTAGLTACSEQLTQPGQCPELCPGGTPQGQEVILTALTNSDSTFTGYTERASGSLMLIGSGIPTLADTSYGVLKFAARSDSILFRDTLRSYVIDSVRITLERCPPELSADLVDRGLVLAGGGALLRGFDRLLSEETGLPVHVAEDPLSAVAEGTGKCLNEIKFLRQVATADRQWRQ